jgi:CDP-diacylglycerol--glycerol-3-phosphate 3-phosphatidyltransferase
MSVKQEAQATGPPAFPGKEPSPFNLPNFLTALRFGLAVVMFVLIGQHRWGWTGVAFALASLTDWLDGLAARRLGITSSFGRSFDPLVDKLLICGAYICLLALPTSATGLFPWMVVVVVTRELLVTSLRGYCESQGIAFGADKWGKIKMVLQCLALAMILLCLLLEIPDSPAAGWDQSLWYLRNGFIYGMVAATVYSGLQYLWTSYRLYQRHQMSS